MRKLRKGRTFLLRVKVEGSKRATATEPRIIARIPGLPRNWGSVADSGKGKSPP